MANAYGFVGIIDLYNQRVNQVGTQRIYTAIQESLAEHTRTVNGLMEALVERTILAQEQFELPGGGTLQPLDEHGNPIPEKPSGSYQVAYPIQGGGTAWGTNRVTSALMTVAEANRHTVNAQQKDADWLKRHIMAALLDNASWTYNDKVGRDGSAGLGNITIQPLANGDSVVYVRKGGAVTTDNHYLAQANAIDDDNNPFQTIYDELMEHPSNSGPVVCYVASNLVGAIKDLADFTEKDDPDIKKGANSDVLVGSISQGFGDEVWGKVNGCWIVEWKSLPDGYMIAHARGAGAVLKMREYPAEELQGFFPETNDVDGNHMENRVIRYAGFGVSNRVGAVCYQVGNGTYQVPSAYNAPLAV